MPRLNFPRKIKAVAFKRADGKCEKCKAVLKTREGEVDHILPDALGGEPILANAQVLCRVCHKEKTKGDVRRVRKSDRQRDKNTGAVKPKGSIPTRPKPRKQKPVKLEEQFERRSLYRSEA